MASTSSAAAAASLPSSSSGRPEKYGVFISFRGEDTRTNFTSHLHGGLCRRNIETYVDDRLDRGDVISQALIKAIEDSYVSLIVFSENYASSKWCLDELTKIIECKELKKQIVIPVFYKVDPSDVRRQMGSYRSALARHEKDLKHDKNKVLKWKAALTEAANLAGYDSRNYRTEYELVEQIVKEVMRKLNHVYPSKSEHFVGIEENCVLIESLLTSNPSRVEKIGIWGMGGIGKTTLATVLFEKLSAQYEGRCFLKDVREDSKRLGLNSLRNKLISALLGEENICICTPKVPSSFALGRLNRRRVFIVLDDVSDSKQLEYLVGEHNCLGLGSTVIVTSRDRHVLSRGVDQIYEVKTLNPKDSLQLFCLKAFNKNNPEMQLEKQSTRIVEYAQGIPLVLNVLGIFLRSKSTKKWDSALRKLQKISNREIQDVLRLSYDELDDKDQDLFLDIAFFLKGWHKDDVTRLLDGCDFYRKIGIKNLADKALITISDDDTIEMHDLIQEMGWDIVRQESIKNPENRSRLKDPEEVYHVLKNNKGTDAIEGIVLNAYQFGDLYLASDVFRKMTKLRFLKFDGGKRCNVYLPSGVESLPNSLIYLHWRNYPLKSLPSTFCPEKLVKINMQHSLVEKLWDGVQNLASLEVIDLSYSKNLLELPDLSRASNLETINLSCCTSLHEVHPSILSLQKLKRMRLDECKSLKSFKSSAPLRHLSLRDCLNLREFSIRATKMDFLDLSSTAIDELPPSVSLIEEVRIFCFRPSESLYKLHTKFLLGLLLEGSWKKSDISTLHNVLEIFGDIKLLALHDYTFSELPNNINKLESLLYLSLDGIQVERLPANIKDLSHLKFLGLDRCKKLQCLPELPPSLLCLYATDCISLETVFTSTCDSVTPRADNRAFFSFGNCVKLSEYAVNSIVADVHVRIKQAANDLLSLTTREEDLDFNFLFDETGSRMCFYLPGGKCPDWFSYYSAQPSLTIEIPSHSKFLGFAFCIITAVAELDYHWNLGCECSFEVDNGETIKFKSQFSKKFRRRLMTLISDHIFLWYDAHCCDQIVDAVKNNSKNYNPKFSFKFFIETENRHYLTMNMSPHVVSNEMKDAKEALMIKSCGVHPIYASKYLTTREEGSIKSNRSLEIHELESLPKITRQVIPPPFSSGSWKQNESKGLKEILS